jgi:phage shock protein A
VLREPTHNEQRLIGICRRLLRQNETLIEQIDRLYKSLRWLSREYRELKARFDRAAADHATVEAAYDVMLAAALDDEPLSGTPSGKR